MSDRVARELLNRLVVRQRSRRLRGPLPPAPTRPELPGARTVGTPPTPAAATPDPEP